MIKLPRMWINILKLLKATLIILVLLFGMVASTSLTSLTTIGCFMEITNIILICVLSLMFLM